MSDTSNGMFNSSSSCESRLSTLFSIVYLPKMDCPLIIRFFLLSSDSTSAQLNIIHFIDSYNQKNVSSSCTKGNVEDNKKIK